MSWRRRRSQTARLRYEILACMRASLTIVSLCSRCALQAAIEQLQSQVKHLHVATLMMRQRSEDASQEHALHTDKLLKLLTEERQRTCELSALLRAEREAKRQALANHDRAVQDTRESLTTTLMLQEEHQTIHARLDVTLREYHTMLTLCRPYL